MRTLQELTESAIIITERKSITFQCRRASTMNEEWVTMSEAAAAIGISLSKISRLAALGRIKTRSNPYDERTKLVDLVELRKIFPVRK